MFFKAKDLMTVGNIGGGLASALVAMEGMTATTTAEAATYVFWSGFFLMVSYVFDAFDGVVARALKQVNRFGAEFDNVADLVSWSVAPSFLLYLAYSRMVVLPGISDYVLDLPFLTTRPEAQILIAILVALPLAIFGSIRFARFNIRKLDVNGVWIGFPRPAGALLLMALVNSHLFASSPTVQWLGVGIVLGVGGMNLSLVPFISHHGRKFSWYLAVVLNSVWASVFASFVGGVLLGVLPANLFFDWVLVWLCCYLFIGWTDIPTRTRQAIGKLTADWNK